MASIRVRWSGIILIVITGLLNFHIPHFLLEGRTELGTGEYALECVLLANVIAAFIATIGIYRSRRWGWQVGVTVCAFSLLLWIAQETIGLPGLPQQWLEPSRIVSLFIEGTFVAIAWRVARAAARANTDIRARSAR